MTTNDSFVKWMLGVSSAIVVMIVSAIFGSILTLREDLATIKVELENVTKEVTIVHTIQKQVDDHEYRIRWIERENPDHQSSTAISRDYSHRNRDSVQPQ